MFDTKNIKTLYGSKITFLFFMLVVLLSVPNKLSSQTVFISEYYNAVSPAFEWTELIVVAENVTLSGYVLRDNVANSGMPNSWQGGVKFNDNALWRNLRSGTVIVINHRNSGGADYEKADGYIEVSAEDERFFSKHYDACDAATWYEKALSIAAVADILQILDDEGNHVHSLSHMIMPGGDYNLIKGMKLNYGRECPGNSSLKVIPGLQMKDYYPGHGTSLAAADNVLTKGLPNNSKMLVDRNQEFWHTKRAPEWDTPQGSATLAPDKKSIKLTWNAADDILPQNNYQGYLLVKIPSNSTGLSEHPKDGTTYQADDDKFNKLGSGAVITHVLSSEDRVYIDSEVECGESYVYRIYAYRFEEDDTFGNPAPQLYARGREYNETDYTEINVDLDIPAKPTILVEDGRVLIYNNETVKLSVKTAETVDRYEWYKDAVIIPGETSADLIVSQTGEYSARIYSDFNCYGESDPMKITKIIKKDTKLVLNDQDITQDTIMRFCIDDLLIFRAFGGEKVNWYKDDELILEDSDEYQPFESGRYFAVVFDYEETYKDTTLSFVLKLIQDSFYIDQDTLRFYLTADEQGQMKPFYLENTGTDTLYIEVIDSPPNFYVSSDDPLVIFPVESNPKRYEVTFDPSFPGVFMERIVFTTECGTKDTVVLLGVKESKYLTATPNNIEFAPVLICEDEQPEADIVLKNNETTEIDVELPLISAPFELVSHDLPKAVQPGATTNIRIKFNPQAVGFFKKNMSIPFSFDNKGTPLSSEVKVLLRGTVLVPSYDLEYIVKDIPTFAVGTLYEEYDIDITNTGETSLTFSTPSGNSAVEFLNLPIVIAATETKTLSYRFTAPIEFDFDEMINIEAEPCGILKLLNIKYTNRPVEFSPDKWDVDFGDNNFCTFIAPQTQTIELIFSGNLATDPKIASIEDFSNSCFSSDLSVGQSLTYTNTITISFDPSAEGEYIDSLVLYLDPGNKRRVVYVRGKINQTNYSIDKQTLDFGTFGLGGSGSEQFTISNTGSTTITIDNISGVSPPYSYNAANPSLPFDIYPNETKDIIIDYMSAEPFNQKFSINVLFAEPCTADSIIVLNARTYDDRRAEVKISTSAEIRGKAGDIRIFPIYFELDKNYSAPEVNITSIKGVFRTNPTLLKMLDVKVGTSLATASVSGLTFNEDTPGRVEFSSQIGDPSKIINGTVVEIECKVLMGDKLITDIVADGFEFDSDILIEAVIDSGSFVLEGACALDKRLMVISGDVQLILAGANPVRDRSEIIIETVSEDITSLSLYDIEGKLLRRYINSSLKPGIKLITFDSADYPSGSYRLVLRSGNTVKHLTITNLR